ncbi:hypothetical protein [Flavobacterium sp.]|jgi:hypothetical protein|uniref:hypothetical protein n=1 Tax=Flavobacterium sp. TaxID=239 RepID=UPI0037BE7628
MVIIKKISIFIKAILLISLVLYLTHLLEIKLIEIKWITDTDGEAKVGLYGATLTLIGIFYGVMQLQMQRKDSLIATEYLNQPNFIFNKFCTEDLLKKYGHPQICCDIETNLNNCIDEHWFDIKNIGKFPAKEFKISMFHKNEKNIAFDDKRILKEDTLYVNDSTQYRLPPYSFKDIEINAKLNENFYVLISYKSLYSNIKYKRIYRLDYSPAEKVEVKNGYWNNNIKFFAVDLENITDINSIKLSDIIVGKITYLLYKTKILSEFTKENWLKKY